MASLNYNQIVDELREEARSRELRNASPNMTEMVIEGQSLNTFPTIGDRISNTVELDGPTLSHNEAIQRLSRYLDETIDGTSEEVRVQRANDFSQNYQPHNLCQEIPDPSITNKVVDTMFLEAVHMVDSDKKYINGNITFNPQTNKLIVYDAQGDTFIGIAIETDIYKNPIGVTINDKGINLKEYQQDKTTNLVDDNIYNSSELDELKKLI